MSNRAASLCKHECAPYCYATALLDDDADPRQEAAAQMMLADWKALCMIEQSEAVGAQDLAVEMQNCIYPPTRLAFLSFGNRRSTRGLGASSGYAAIFF